MSEPHYHINVFWHAPDQCFIANVPDLKGCSAHGSTPEEAVAQARIAIDVWLEVAREDLLAVPEPRDRPAIYTVNSAGRAQA